MTTSAATAVRFRCEASIGPAIFAQRPAGVKARLRKNVYFVEHERGHVFTPFRNVTDVGARVSGERGAFTKRRRRPALALMAAYTKSP